MIDGDLVENPNPFGEIDETKLSDFMSILPYPLPSDYLSYLREYNGGKLGKNYYRSQKDRDLTTNIHFMFGLHD